MANIKKIKLKGTTYDVRDANTLRSLTSAQEATLLSDGTYNGVAVADGEIFTSVDGDFKKFEAGTAPQDLTHGNGSSPGVAVSMLACLDSTHYFVISYNVPAGSTLLKTSSDLVSWNTDSNFATVAAALGAGNNVGIATDGVNTVVVAHGANSIIYSTDKGATWQSVANAFAGLQAPTNILYRGTKFFNVGRYTTPSVSSDGYTWTACTLPAGTASFIDVIYTGTKYVALPLQGTNSKFLESTDGSTWTEIASSNITIDGTRYAYHNTCGNIVFDGSKYYVLAYPSSNTNVRCLLSTSDFSSWEKELETDIVIDRIHLLEGIFVLSSASSTSINKVYLTTDKRHLFQIDFQYPATRTTGLELTSYNQYGPVQGLWFSPFGASGYFQVVNSSPIVPHYWLVDKSYSKDSIDSMKLLGNTATGTGSLFTTGAAATNTASTTYSTAIGIDAFINNFSYSTAVGNQANANGSRATSLGYYSIANNSYTTAVGNQSVASGNQATMCGATTNTSTYGAKGASSCCLGYNAKAAADYGLAIGAYADSEQTYAIQLGYGTNNTANTFSVGLSNSNNYELLSSDGSIPFARLSKGIIEGASDPTTATVGSVGLLYRNTTDGGIFKCTAVSGSTYTWEELGAGGGGSVSLSDIAVAGDNVTFETFPYGTLNITKVGSPSISSAFVASNFSDSNYFETTDILNNTTTSFEVVVPFTTPQSAATNCSLIDKSQVNGRTSFRLEQTSTKIQCRLSNSPSDSTYFATLTGTTNLTYGQKYWAKVTYDSAEGYKLFLSADGENWHLEASTPLTTMINQDLASPLIIGDNAATGSSFPGSIYLAETYIRVNGGEYEWHAVNVTSTKQQINASGLQNTATGAGSLTVLGTATSSPGSVNLGSNAKASYANSVAVGAEANAYSTNSTAIGYDTYAREHGIAIGSGAKANANYSIQIGGGSNGSSGTMNVSLLNVNYILLSSDGTIPVGRLNHAFPGGTSTAVTVGATGATYTATANGYFCASGKFTSAGQVLQLVNSSNNLRDTATPGNQGYGTLSVLLPVRKGDTVALHYSCTVNDFWFIAS